MARRTIACEAPDRENADDCVDVAAVVAAGEDERGAATQPPLRSSTDELAIVASAVPFLDAFPTLDSSLLT